MELEFQWVKQSPVFNTTNTQDYPAIVSDNQNNLYLAYVSNGIISGGTNYGFYDVIIVKFNSDGEVIWIKQSPILNTIETELYVDITLDNNNNIFISYVSSGEIEGGTKISGGNIIVSKISPETGDIIWIKQEPIYNSGSTSFYNTIKSDGQNLYIVYTTTGTVSGGTNIGGTDIVVLKLDNNGNYLWSKQNPLFNTTENDFPAYTFNKIDIDNNGNIYICYYTFGGEVSGATNMGFTDIIVFKLNTNGDLQWVKQNSIFNSISGSEEPVLTVDKFGNVYVAYATYGVVSGGTSISGYDIVIMKMDSLTGNIIWIKQDSELNTPSSFYFSSIDNDTNGNIYVSYMSFGQVQGGTYINSPHSSIVIAKLNTNGVLQWIKQEPIITALGGSNNTITIHINSLNNLFGAYITSGIISGGTQTSLNDVVVFRYGNNESIPPIPPINPKKKRTIKILGISKINTISGVRNVSELVVGDIILTANNKEREIISINMTRRKLLTTKKVTYIINGIEKTKIISKRRIRKFYEITFKRIRKLICQNNSLLINNTLIELKNCK